MFLFVYGTLQSFNSRKMTRLGCKYVGKARTKEKFSLHIDNLIPFLHDDEKRYHIYGEVYEVRPSALEILDEYEIEGQWYHRKPLSVILVPQDVVMDNYTEIDAEAYFCNDVGILLSHGSYEDYAVSRKI